MGLFPQSSGPSGIPTPSPAETSMRLMEQASLRTSQAQQIIQATPLSMAQNFASQFQQRFQQVQGLQSLSPLQAQAMAAQMAQSPTGQGQDYYPSPLTMTPASSGVFRPPTPRPMTAIPPMYTPQIFPMSFQPQMPQPMFRSPWEQQAMTQDLQSNRMFSYGMQAPSVAGQAIGIGAGAIAGSRMMGGFGPMGRLAGAIGGGLLASRSGFADTLGDVAQYPFQPMAETRQMGAAMQRMSQDWVVTGPQMHSLGRGLTQQASIGLAGGIRDLASDSGFKGETGGMFNRQDLMRMTQLSGQAGLMDMSQSTDAIKGQLRQVASTVRKFMELTNDPDVTNVIRQMGQMQQFGMTLPQINQAAEGMRMFSRAAGTSMQGLRAAGGMPGAAIFQGAGLTAGQGYNYGNYALMQARQTVATGGVNPQQLALLGGVQGMAQRDMQAQAAFMSMPVFAAANAQFGGRGEWGVNRDPRQMGGGQGAFGMVNAAVSNINQGVQRGGLGALVSFQLQQQELADTAASKMTPMEQTAQRFRMARQTGERFRFKGMEALSFGASLMYGTEVGQQMTTMAKSPDMLMSQYKMYGQRGDELALEQRSEIEGRAPGFFSRNAPSSPFGKIGRDASRMAEPFRQGGRMLSEAGTAISDWWNTPSGVSRFRPLAGTGLSSADMRNWGGERGIGDAATTVLGGRGLGGAIDEMAEWGRYATNRGTPNAKQIDWGLAIGTPIPLPDSITQAVIGGISLAPGVGSKDLDKVRNLMEWNRRKEEEGFLTTERGNRFQGNRQDIQAGASALSAMTGNKAAGIDIMTSAAATLAQKSADYIWDPTTMTQEDFDKITIEAIAKKGGLSVKDATAKFKGMSPEARQQITSQVVNFARGYNATADHVLGVVSAGQGRENYYKRVDTATTGIQKAQLGERAALEKRIFDTGKWRLDKQGGTDPTKGMIFDENVGSFFGSDEFKKTRGLMRGLGSQNAVILAAAAYKSQGGSDAYERAWAYFKGKNPQATKEGFEKVWTEANLQVGSMGQEQKEKMAVLGGGSLSDVEKMSKQLKQEGLTQALRSSEFTKMFEGAGGEGFRAALQSKEGVTNLPQFLQAVGEGGFQKMAASGSEMQKALGKAGLGALKGDQKSKEKFLSMAAQFGKEDVQDRVTTTAAGPAAKAAADSKDAAGEMAMVASELLPAAVMLNKAATKYMDAVTIDMQNKMQGRK